MTTGYRETAGLNREVRKLDFSPGSRGAAALLRGSLVLRSCFAKYALLRLSEFAHCGSSPPVE
jgi:hypothetical protein